MREKTWKIPYCQSPAPKIFLDAGFGPLLSQLMAIRGISSLEDARSLISGGAEQLFDAGLILNMDVAAKRILDAISSGEKVAVFGDYDVDGITATCVVSDYLRSRGLVCFPYIPDRSEEGYGLNQSAVKQLSDKGVTLIITVDCGITAKQEAEFARSLGMDIIITDHHEYSEAAYPAAAVAVIDTKQPGDTYPNRYLAGVGVALKLVCAVDGNEAQMIARYADLVAIGTVADVMPLIGENRYLVKRGLASIDNAPRPGIAAMLRESSMESKKLTASSIGFSLAPRLNAAGRVGTPITAAKLLMTDDPDEAASLASSLCRLNAMRQSIELNIWESAAKALESAPPTGPIVLSGDSWHQGVIGIAASRLSDQYCLPAIMICLNGDIGKGSCRSYGGFNLFEALSACKEHLIGFGGHALAAGLNIKREKIDDFRKALNEYYAAHAPEPVPDVMCDMLITDPAMLSIDNVRSLDRLEPFGNANPKPLMCVSDVLLESLSAVGSGKHLKMRVKLGSQTFDAIFFSHTAEELGISEGMRVDIAFNPSINDYHGHVSVQFVVSAVRPHDPYELCSLILSKNRDALRSALKYRPDRNDFVQLWKGIRYGSFRTAKDVAGIISQRVPGMSPEKFALCIAVLHEAGLLKGEGGSVFDSAPASIDGKADLDATETMHVLNSLK